MPNDALKKTVKSLLCHPMLMLINFDLNGRRVTGLGYGLVRLALDAGRITCEVGVPQRAGLSAGTFAAAQYDPQANQFHFPRETFGEYVDGEKLSIVHEATHAQFDLAAPKAGDYSLAIDDEAAAWLAEALFGRLAERSGAGPLIEGSAGWEALKLADSILAGTDLRRVRNVYRVPPNASASLRNAVARDYNLQGDHAGIKYVYDGV